MDIISRDLAVNHASYLEGMQKNNFIGSVNKFVYLAAAEI